MKTRASENAIESTTGLTQGMNIRTRRSKILLILIPCVVLFILAIIGFMMRDSFYKASLEKNTVLQTIDGIVVNEITGIGVYASGDEIQKNDWRDYPDVEKIQSKIEGQLNGFAKAAKAKNVNKMLQYLSEANKEKYELLFTENRDQLNEIAPLFEDWTLVFLSEPTDKKASSSLRIAECSVLYEGHPFSIVLIEENGKWLIKNF